MIPARFGLATRIALIVMAALVLAQIFMAIAYFADRRRGPDGFIFSTLMVRIAALTQLLERLPPEDRGLALKAAGGFGFHPRIVEAQPEGLRPSLILRPAARRLRQLLGGTPGRFIQLSLSLGEPRQNRTPFLGGDGGRPPPPPGVPGGPGGPPGFPGFPGDRMRAVVALEGGGYLDVEAGEGVAMRLLGLPLGLLAGFLGLLVAAGALLAVRRETRPLTDLAAAVERFGKALEPQAVPEAGAPDVRDVIRAVNAMQARITELVRNRTLVLGAISHDLRTHLTRLRLRLELLPDSPQRTKAQEDLDSMQALMDDALSFARASFGGATDEVVDLAAVLRSEFDARKAQGATVSLTGAETPVLVRGAAGALARVVTNLVGNALAYGYQADLTLVRDAEMAEILVEDRGPGIPAAERSSVFEPFYRIEPSRNRESGGAGLGLTIVRQIVEGAGGSVAIEDRPGGGARLRVRLPYVETE